jgi:glycosyltransferase involved in cell wall biosynthesis
VSTPTGRRRLRVAWINDFPFEWLSDVPEPFKTLPKGHPLSWQRVLLQEFENEPSLELHVCFLRKRIQQDYCLERNGVTFHARKVLPRTRATSLHWVDTALIKPILRRIQPDVVHAWGTEGGAALVAKRSGWPYLVTIQGLLRWYRQLIPMPLQYGMLAHLESWSLKRAPLVTTESRAAVQFLHNEIPNLRVFQAEHAPDWLFHRLQRKPQMDPIRFLFVGHIGHRKGVDLILSALDQLKDSFAFELVMIGNLEPDTKDYIEARVSTEVSKRMTVRANLPPDAVAQELARATMLLFPTRADTSPNAVKEAVVAGVPVVGSDIGGIPDYVVPDRNGFIFHSGNLDGFIAAIRRAVAHPLFRKGEVDPVTLNEMREYLSPSRMAERFLEAYQTVAADKNHQRHRLANEPAPVLKARV